MKKSLLTVSLSFALAACSGGSGGGSSAAAPTPTVNNNPSAISQVRADLQERVKNLKKLR